jgi:hypothetical protein
MTQFNKKSVSYHILLWLIFNAYHQYLWKKVIYIGWDAMPLTHPSCSNMISTDNHLSLYNSGQDKESIMVGFL